MCSEKHLAWRHFPKAPALRRSWRCARAGKSERVCRGPRFGRETAAVFLRGGFLGMTIPCEDVLYFFLEI